MMLVAAVPTYAGDAFTSALRWAILVLVIMAVLTIAWIFWRVGHPRRRPWWRSEKSVARPMRQGYSRRHP